MEQYEALTNVIRTLSKKCEDIEHHKQQAELYERWWRQERDQVRSLNNEIDRLNNEIDRLQNQTGDLQSQFAQPYNERERND